MKRTRTCILCGPWTKKLRCAISYSAAFRHPTTAFWAFVWCRFPAPPAIHVGVLAGAAFREDQKHCAPCGHLGEMGVIWYERLGFAFSPALERGLVKPRAWRRLECWKGHGIRGRGDSWTNVTVLLQEVSLLLPDPYREISRWFLYGKP